MQIVTGFALYAGLALFAGQLALPAQAQDSNYPTRSIRLIIPYAPGGGTDAIARLFGDRLSKVLRQPVIPDNRPGAGGQIAANALKLAEPDGYTLFWGGSSWSVVAPLVEKNLPYDPVRDLTTVALATTATYVLVVPASAKVASLQQLLQDLRSPSKELSYGSAGVATPMHIAAAALTGLSKGRAEAVQYKGSAPALQDLLAGRLSFSFDTVVSSTPHIQSGKLVGLAVLSPQRVKALPNVPTMAEAGFPAMMQYNWQFWQALQASSKTPRAIVRRLAEAMRQVSNDPEVLARVEAMGLNMMPQLTPEEADQLVQRDVAAFRALFAKVDIVRSRP